MKISKDILNKSTKKKTGGLILKKHQIDVKNNMDCFVNRNNTKCSLFMTYISGEKEEYNCYSKLKI